MSVFDPRLEFYAITDQLSAQGRSDEEIAKGLIQGGCSCLQYRAKKVHAAVQWKVALKLRELTRRAGVIFIVNDRIDLALDVEADGVHLGQDDAPVAAARRAAVAAGRELLVGKSTHSLEQALAAAAEEPDYIACGPLYATQTKENNVAAVGPALLKQVLQDVKLPVVAIGGIKFEQLGEVAAQGARHVCVVTALTSAADPASEAARYAEAWRALQQAKKRTH